MKSWLFYIYSLRFFFFLLSLRIYLCMYICNTSVCTLVNVAYRILCIYVNIFFCISIFRLEYIWQQINTVRLMLLSICTSIMVHCSSLFIFLFFVPTTKTLYFRYKRLSNISSSICNFLSVNLFVCITVIYL